MPLSNTVKSTTRNANIDILRGFLIVLVIIGHVVLGSVHDNVIRYSIYAFHMPLFIGLSGYLINPLSLQNSDFLSVLNRYWHRVLLPFLFAFIVYTGVLIFHAFEEGRLSVQLLLSYLLTPYYHLWFVPTLVIWVFAFWAILKLKLPLGLVLLVCLIASLLWGSIPKSQQWFILAPLLSKKVVYFFLFFMFGAYLRSGVKNKVLNVVTDFKVLPVSIIAACACIYLLNIGVDKSPLRAVVWLLMNVLLIVVSVQAMNYTKPVKKVSVKKPNTMNAVLEAMGRNSLPIYLWHVAPLFILKGFDVHQTHIGWYYIISGVSIVSLCAFILKFENKNSVLNRILYGNAISKKIAPK